MQKRFCSCGNMVMVHYLLKNGRWVPLFIAAKGTQRRHTLHVCPECGAPIDIHALS